MTFNHGVVSGATLVSRLTPMKRILCLCPVPVCEEAPKNADVAQYSLGMAVSDPYLSFSCPVTLDVPISLGVNYQGGKRKYSFKNMPSCPDAFADAIGFTDFAAIVFALPLAGRSEAGSTSSHTSNTPKELEARNTFLGRIKAYQGGHNSADKRFTLLCCINETLTIDQAVKMSKEEPDMWECVDLQSKDPSVHACISLNAFLWEQTGGWHNNTFG